MITRVRVVIQADIDLDKYRREYAQPETKAEAIKNAVREDIIEAAKTAYPMTTFGGMVKIRAALR